jgi:hypothetical protein
LAEGVEQVLNRPLAHPRRAIEAKLALAQRHHRSQETHRRAAVGHVQVAAARGQPARAPLHGNLSFSQIDIQPHAQLAQRRDHNLRVFAIERAVKLRVALGQRRAEQRAVGNALGSRRTNRASKRTGWLDFDGAVHSLSKAQAKRDALK